MSEPLDVLAWLELLVRMRAGEPIERPFDGVLEVPPGRPRPVADEELEQEEREGAAVTEALGVPTLTVTTGVALVG